MVGIDAKIGIDFLWWGAQILIANATKPTTRGTMPQWETTTRVGTCLWHVMGENLQKIPTGWVHGEAGAKYCAPTGL